MNGTMTAIVNGALVRVPAFDDLTLVEPAKGRVTQHFGARSVTGILHRGVDLGIAGGTAVGSAAEGVVLSTRTGSWPWYGPLPRDYRGVDTSYGGYGNHVVVDHGGLRDGSGARWLITTIYAHLSTVAVKAGQRLRAGEPLGRSGSTGISTGDHLHWEVRRTADPFDPTDYLNREIFMDYPIELGAGVIELEGSENGAPFNRYVTVNELRVRGAAGKTRVRMVLQLFGGHPGSFASLRDAAGNSLCFTTVQSAFAHSPDAIGELLLDEYGGFRIAGQSMALKRRRLELPPKQMRAVITVFARERAA